MRVVDKFDPAKGSAFTFVSQVIANVLYTSVSTARRDSTPDRLSPPDEQTEIDDEISDQLKEDAGSRHHGAIMPQIPSGFGQNRGILFFAEDTSSTTIRA